MVVGRSLTVAVGSEEMTGSSCFLPSRRVEVGESGAKETERLCGLSMLLMEEIDDGEFRRAVRGLLA